MTFEQSSPPPQSLMSDNGDAKFLPSSSPRQDMILQYSTRYSDLPMSLGTRLFSIGGISVITLLMLAVALVSWTKFAAPSAAPPMIIFDVAPPAAPPVTPSEIPPGPEQVEKERPLIEPDQPKIEPPVIQLRSDNQIIIPTAKSIPDPGPPAEKTTAPEARPAPPAPQASTGKATWEGMVLGALNKVKRYPRDAEFARRQGVPWIRFTMDRDGKVLSVTLERSSGVSSLDREAVALPKRAQPLPKPPEDMPGGMIELVVPVEFFLRR